MRTPIALLLACACAQNEVPRPAADPPNTACCPPPENKSVSEEFATHGVAALDVLWVVDDPLPDAEALAAELAQFSATFAQTDVAWRLGVVAMAPADTATLGELISVDGALWLEPGAGDPAAFLAAAINQLPGMSGGAPRAYDVVQGVSGFFRDGSAIAVTVVTTATLDESLVSTEEFVAWTEATRGDPRYFSLHALTACTDDPGDYAAAALALGGDTHPLCSGAPPSTLARDVLYAEWEYFLGDVPTPGTLQLTVEQGGYIIGFDPVDPETGTGDYRYSDPHNSAQFVSYRPDLDSVVWISYLPLIDPTDR